MLQVAKRARDVMNAQVVRVRADMSVRELAAFLVENEISGAPVEDADGNLVGVVSLTDIALASSDPAGIVRDLSNPDYFVRGWEDRLETTELAAFHIEDEGLQVADIMTPSLYTVDEAATVSEVARTLLAGHVHRLLVTRAGKVVGIITTSDLLRLLA